MAIQVTLDQRDLPGRAAGPQKAASVPVISIVDFDTLRSNNDLNNLMIAPGGDPSSLGADLNILRNAISSKDTPVNRSAAQARIEDILRRGQGEIVNSSDREQISKI